MSDNGQSVNYVAPRPYTQLWQAHLDVEARGGRTERHFEAESCQAIASATAIIIALAADIGDAGRTAGTEQPPPAPTQAECRA